mmetsp:Transcript_70268/g.147102  ORF Transcript_70268/g.147102 Transcript_70268/m.147102 type:complete len:226 (+) Transcript_70268:225-902(+)
MQNLSVRGGSPEVNSPIGCRPHGTQLCTTIRLVALPRSSINGLHVDRQVHQSVGIAPLVVVPGHELHKCVSEADASADIKDGGGLAGGEVRGDHLLVGPVKDALHVASSVLLHGCDDLLVLGRLLQSAGQIDDRDVRSRHPEGHAGQFAIHGRQHLADSLGGTRGGGNDVLGGASATSPVLATSGRSIHSQLSSSHGVHSGHQSLQQAELLLDHLGEGSQAVGRA